MTKLRVGLGLYGLMIGLMVWGIVADDPYIFTAGCLTGTVFCWIAWLKGPYR